MFEIKLDDDDFFDFFQSWPRELQQRWTFVNLLLNVVSSIFFMQLVNFANKMMMMMMMMKAPLEKRKKRKKNGKTINKTLQCILGLVC